MNSPNPARAALPANPVDEIEIMIMRLIELRTAEESAERREDYRHAIDRLDALTYRLKLAAKPGRVIGMPKPPVPVAAPPVIRKPPQAPLPLGPVIVRARKPRR